MDLGFNLQIHQCNVNTVIGFICVMVMVVVLFVSAKGILNKVVNREKKEKQQELVVYEKEKEDD